jgi:CheY-like chemotaxis protein
LPSCVERERGYNGAVTADLSETNRPVRVLVVEDNRVNRLVVCQMLKHANASGTEAEDGASAIDLLATGSFDLVLMDVDMPRMDGLEATRAIRSGAAGETCRNIPIVAMTGFTSSEEEQACYDAGMSAHLKKPLSLSRFVEVVRSVLEN